MALSQTRGNDSCTSDIFSDIILDRVEHYDASQQDCYAFRRGTDVREGKSLALGNMVNGFPFTLHGVEFANSECAYICGAFSDGSEAHTNLQRELAQCFNGYLAKKAIRRPHDNEKRADWEAFNIQWMLYVVWHKVLCNSDFQKVLLAIPEDAVIIEDSTFQNGPTATVWGTRNKTLKSNLLTIKKSLVAEGNSKAEIQRRLDSYRLEDGSKEGVFEGKNLMGKILMLCARALRNGVVPPIDFELLRAANINLFGKVLDFNGKGDDAEVAPIVSDIILDREEVYNPALQSVWCFKHVDDIVEGVKLDLCNMTSCYPFEVEGVMWRSSEELYLAGEFSNDTTEHRAIQEALRSAKSPYAAKRFVKGKHKKQVREDFTDFRTQWMLWVVWQKCKGNIGFRRKLLSIPDNVTLVEETTTDTGGSGQIWGCSNRELVAVRKTKAEDVAAKYPHLSKLNLKYIVNVETNAIRNVGLFKGQNNIGKILMICRRCIIEGTEPTIDIDLLRSKEIHILGKKLTFA